MKYIIWPNASGHLNIIPVCGSSSNRLKHTIVQNVSFPPLRLSGLRKLQHDNESQIDQVSVGCSEETSPIHGGPTPQLSGVKGSAVNIWVPHTESISRWVRAFMVAQGEST